VIPDYALTPRGTLSATILYWKRLRRPEIGRKTVSPDSLQG